MSYNGTRMAGFNNIELITDRPLEVNLREIKQVKRDWPDRAMVVSLMVPCEEDNWRAILARVEETGADAVELNFGCPHGMRSEEHTSELQSLMRISYAVFCLTKNKSIIRQSITQHYT